MKTQFMHLLTEDHGGVTLAIERTEVTDGLAYYEVGAAFASPQETHFSKKKGRLIAEGRLRAQRYGWICFKREEKSKKNSINKTDILSYLPALQTRPRREDANLPGPEWYYDFLQELKAQFQQG